VWHGCTHIAGLYPLRVIQQDFLTYGANLISGLGFRTIKLELSIAYDQTKYPNQSWVGTPTTLAQLAAQPAFDTVFSSADFDRVWLSVFSLVNSTNNPWGYEYTKAFGDQMEQEFYDLCVYLLTNYSNKEFILSNWEGDWQLLLDFNPNTAIKRSTLQSYRDYNRRRIRAMQRARAAVPASTSILRFSLEVNRALDGWRPRLHSDVLGNITPDLVSLSCYEAIEGWQDGLSQSALEADILVKLTQIVNRIRKKFDGPIAIGEFGWPIYNPGFVAMNYDMSGLLNAVINACNILNIEGAIYWQILDNEQQAPGVPYGFALYDRDGNSDVAGPLNDVGLFYQSLLS
jgi:hypothetical protein